ncbi:hypothetical protein V3565_04510 [Bartonella sp. B10]
MNPLIFVLLLVSCTDDFNNCYSNNTMVQTYTTAQECEQAMIPSTKKFAFHGQQIFAQCIDVHTNLHHKAVDIIWFVTNRGNFLLKRKNIDDNLHTSHKTDTVTTESPSYIHFPIDHLYKNH